MQRRGRMENNDNGDPSISVTSDGETSSNIDQDLDAHEAMATLIVHKKRARINFTEKKTIRLVFPLRA